MEGRKEYCYAYPRPMLTADCVVSDGRGSILLVRRGNPPYQGAWALPGGFMEMGETLEQCAARELEEEAGVKVGVADLSLVGVFSQVERDPRGRTVSTAYSVEVDRLSADPHAGDDAAEVRWFEVANLPTLAFDHGDIVKCWRCKKNGA